MGKIDNKKNPLITGEPRKDRIATICTADYKAKAPQKTVTLDAIEQAKEVLNNFDLITYSPDQKPEYCFINKPDGLYVHKAPNGVPDTHGMRLAYSEVQVKFKFKSDKKSVDAGKVITFKNDFGQEIEVGISYKELQQPSTALREKLASLGLKMPLKTPNSRDFLMVYLNESNPQKEKTSIKRTGWLRDEDGLKFAMPYGILGDASDRYFIANKGVQRSNDYIKTKGSLAVWQIKIGKLAEASSRDMAAICAVLAGPLIEITNSENFAVHFRGGSSSGKTVLLRIARSVIGDFPLLSWSCTNNELEKRMIEHNALSSVMDEIGVNDNLKDIHKKIYRMINGIGKGRMNSRLESEEVETWTGTLISTGEKGKRHIEQMYNIAPEAGTENRFLEIPIDTGSKYRSNEYLPTNPLTKVAFENINDYSLYMNDVLPEKGKAKYCGAPFEAWIKCLLSYTNDGIGDESYLVKLIMKYHNDFYNRVTRKQDGDQVRRACRHFALMYAAGVLASGEGGLINKELLESLGYENVEDITGWNKANVFEAIRKCYEAWREEFSNGENREETVLREKTFNLITENENFIFEKNNLPPYQTKIYGYREIHDNEIRYFIKADLFKKHVAPTKADLKLLKQMGILKVTQKNQGLEHKYYLGPKNLLSTYQIWIPKPTDDGVVNEQNENNVPQFGDQEFMP